MFNEESRMPEHLQGHDETAIITKEAGANEPLQSTNRYDVPPWLQRRFNVEISKRGNPYFTPIESRLQECIRDSQGALDEGRVRQMSDENTRGEIVDEVVAAGRAYHDALKRLVGADRQWKADQLVLWPLSDEVGYQLFAATNGEAELEEYAKYLLGADANIQCANDIEKHAGYQKSAAWVDLAYDELGEYDGIYAGITGETGEYNVPAIVRKGYQGSASMMGRKYLSGNTGSAPTTSDGDNGDALTELKSRRRISAAQ
jgi:hypothetical protein